MRITCPHCAASGNISDALVPDGGRSIACPKCRSKFTVAKESGTGGPTGPSPTPSSEGKTPVTCPSCGASGSLSVARIPADGTTISCPKCKKRFPVKRPLRPGPAASGETVPFRCVRCGREGEVPASQVPEGGTGMNCPGCNARFFVRRPGETKTTDGPAPPPPTGPAHGGAIPALSGNMGLVSPSVAATLSPSAPAYRGGPTAAPVGPRGVGSGGAQSLDDMWSTPSLGRAFAGGAGAAVLGAVLWAFITVMTTFQIGWMAIGVGALVGFAVKFFGRGTEQTYGFAGAGLALFGCVIGNLMASCAFISSDPRNPGLIPIFFDALFSPATAARIMGANFHPLDILFYILAVSTGYKVALSSE